MINFKIVMKYLGPFIASLPIFILPSIGNRSISWGMTLLIFGYFWVGVVLGEEVGRNK